MWQQVEVAHHVKWEGGPRGRPARRVQTQSEQLQRLGEEAGNTKEESGLDREVAIWCEDTGSKVGMAVQGWGEEIGGSDGVAREKGNRRKGADGGFCEPIEDPRGVLGLIISNDKITLLKPLLIII